MNKLNFDIGYIRLDPNKTSNATSFSILQIMLAPAHSFPPTLVVSFL
jgi:hypothetical protein